MISGFHRDSADQIGRPVFATNSAGVKVWTASYAPFGGMTASTGLPIAARFPGQWYQAESGLHQNWMREYDRRQGATSSPIPSASSTVPQSMEMPSKTREGTLILGGVF